MFLPSRPVRILFLSLFYFYSLSNQIINASFDQGLPSSTLAPSTFECKVCGYIYDELKGYPADDISPGTKWPSLPHRYACPVCKADRDEFKPLFTDSFYMQRALQLASSARGHARPNPVVGCVIVDEDGAVVGEGWHVKAGRDHAEVMALKQAGSRATGATAYVSLEPCNHYGRTPPCTLSLIK